MGFALGLCVGVLVGFVATTFTSLSRIEKVINDRFPPKSQIVAQAERKFQNAKRIHL